MKNHEKELEEHQESTRQRLEVLCLSKDEVAEVQGEIKPFIDETVKRMGGRITYDYLMKSLYDGVSNLWLFKADGIIEAAAITWIKEHPSSLRSCQVILAAGSNIETWLRCEGVVTEWAKARGCEIIEAWARPGWEKRLRGYRKRFVLFEKAVV